MKLWIWFEYEKGPYHIEEDRFDTIADAERFWRNDPFFISAETVGAEPPVAFNELVAELYGYPTA